MVSKKENEDTYGWYAQMFFESGVKAFFMAIGIVTVLLFLVERIAKAFC